MNIKNWPKGERPRERLLKNGAPQLSDGELLAILLRHGYQGESALDLSRQLIQEHGGLRGVFNLSFTAFSQKSGLGAAKYCQLQAAMELGRRYLAENLPNRQVLVTSKEAQDYLIAKLRDCQQEVFAGLFLDARHKIIQFEYLFFGTLHYAHVYPREIIKRALHHNAKALIIAHNHPSGHAEPSLEDQNLTKQLKEVLALVEIQLLDHWIIADCHAVSLAERGMLY